MRAAVASGLVVTGPAGGTLLYTIANGTSVPSGASYLLAFTENSDGLGSVPANVSLVDWGQSLAARLATTALLD